MESYHLDFETYSAADIRKVGAYRYANDLSTEILIMSIARGDDAPLTWDILDFSGENKHAVALLKEAIDNGSLIYAHNAQFEAAIFKYLGKKTFGFAPPKLENWRCTAAMCRRAAIPSNLDGAAQFLELDHQKDKEGTRLIRKFSVPRKPTRNDPRTRIVPSISNYCEDALELDDFRKFIAYCEKDVEVEREIHKRLAFFELKGAVLESFQFDQRMNDRGVPVNVAALQHTNAEIDAYSEDLTEQFRYVVGYNPTQREKVLQWMRERGYPFDDLTAPNVDKMLANGRSGWSMRYVPHGAPKGTKSERLPVEMTKEAFLALRLRSMVSYAAVKKVPAMLQAACDDGRVRGALLWSGAERTHRWAGRIIQPQNFRRPTIKSTESAYQDICDGHNASTIEMMHAPFLETVASSIRHFIQWPQGQLLQADYSSVEARAAPWLCGEESALQLFRNNAPIYETMAAKIFGVPVAQIVAEHRSGNSEKRFVGKQATLGATYNMGAATFRGTCGGFGYKPSPDMIEDYKPHYFENLRALRADASIGEPWDKFHTKHSPHPFAKLTNKKGKRQYQIIAARSDGSKRPIVDENAPTAAEWLDLCYDDLASRAIKAWRDAHPNIVKAWRGIDAAAKDALRNVGKVFYGTDKIALKVSEQCGFRALLCSLPSGHILVYPKAKLVWDAQNSEAGSKPNWDDNFNTSIRFWGKQAGKSAWGWCHTYGGKLLENATQAICGDMMSNGAVNAERHGYEAIMLVHDEMIAHAKDGQTHEELCDLLCDLPKWAKGMPLAAEGETIPYYKK